MIGVQTAALLQYILSTSTSDKRNIALCPRKTKLDAGQKFAFSKAVALFSN